MPLHRSESRRQTITGYAFVAAQFALIIALLVWQPAAAWTLPGWIDTTARIVGALGAVWLVLGLLNLGRSATALPLPVEHGELRTGGLFRLSRHPIYTGVLALAWSWAIRASAVGPLALAAALTVVLSVKARFEERILAATYPGYRDYAAGTPRFWPVGRLMRRTRRRTVT